ncbi:DUF4826 family protein [Lacimicrobium alkaliphilum]|uniref:DUF4826 domain-containing protein n=1 Tax=Lacimicrobium alkaliphilum TaxID=1526571 RepID=A0ABQ1R0F4_9ALTE|nr:DUF4826 family protein [Lacimicrobium alkaliphilum]GGD53774.1 DUF4826 domain-containing protein [Lacimicrobium alkaliphilum]
MTQQQQPMSEQDVSAWVKQQLQKCTKFLAEKGIIVASVKMEDSRYLVPWVTAWKVQSTDGKYYWAVAGDLPTDVLPLSAAKDARAALRHLALGWQMKSENIRHASADDKTQQEFADLLDNKSQLLYQMTEQDQVWAKSQ